jgi:predicted transcriptional regulator of viral defense system
VDTNVVACVIKQGSYVSLQSALAFHGMIPEYVVETTCATTGRPLLIDGPIGRIRYRHIKFAAFFGFEREERGAQQAYIATPEKALLDLLYLTPGSENSDYLSELRLQRTENLDVETLTRMAARFKAPRLARVVRLVEELINQTNGSTAE